MLAAAASNSISITAHPTAHCITDADVYIIEITFVALLDDLVLAYDDTFWLARPLWFGARAVLIWRPGEGEGYVKRSDEDDGELHLRGRMV